AWYESMRAFIKDNGHFLLCPMFKPLLSSAFFMRTKAGKYISRLSVRGHPTGHQCCSHCRGTWNSQYLQARLSDFVDHAPTWIANCWCTRIRNQCDSLALM